MSYQADDEEVSVFTYGAEEQQGSEGEVDWSELQEEAVSAQRLVVGRLVRTYTKGRMEVTQLEPKRKVTPEKMFKVVRLIEWNGGEPEAVLGALAAGRVRARLSAAMGTGKSTRLAGVVAETLGVRVLHVVPDALALQQVAVYVAASGLGCYRRNWSVKQESRVCGMTYADFNGYMAISRRADLFKCFDVLIFDEGFLPTADVFVAKRCFSVYAPADVSLLVCSATISTDPGTSMESARMGSFLTFEKDISLEEGILSGKLVGSYLVDRTMAVLPTDTEIDDLLQHYDDNGVDARGLYTASSYEDVRSVCAWLEGDTSVPRVLVAHESFGVAFNFPVEYVILWPSQSYTEVVDGKVVTSGRAMSASMVQQVKARTGRGIVDGSGGMIMSELEGDTVELEEAEKIRAFCKLSAAYIAPAKGGFWDCAYKVFPDGLTADVAATLLKVCMPPEVASMYLGSDGYVARRFVRALNFFSQPDHFCLPSVDQDPQSFDRWVLEDCCSGGGTAPPLRVPVMADGELQVVLHAVSAMADGFFSLERWRPTRLFALDDGQDSEAEDKDSRYGKNSKKLRRLTEQAAALRVADAPVKTAWECRPVPQVGGTEVRFYLGEERRKEAALELERCLNEYVVANTVEVLEVVEEERGTVAVIELEASVDAREKATCSLPVGIVEKLGSGKVLEPREFVQLADVYRLGRKHFVHSKMFDKLSGAWECVLRTLLDEEVIAYLVGKGYAHDAYDLVACLSSRFTKEVGSVMSKSRVFSRRYAKVFQAKMTMDKFMKEVWAGQFDGVAKTDGFIERVKFVKSLLNRAHVRAEEGGLTLPTRLTDIQRGNVSGVAPVFPGHWFPPQGVGTFDVGQRARLARRFGG